VKNGDESFMKQCLVCLINPYVFDGYKKAHCAVCKKSICTECIKKYHNKNTGWFHQECFIFRKRPENECRIKDCAGTGWCDVQR